MNDSEKQTPIIAFADDLTGAMEVGLQSLPALVLNQPKAIRFTHETLVINTRTRELTAEAAYQITKERTQNLYIPEGSVKYYKIDSTMRANIGAGIKALREILKNDLTLIAPALPQNGRITQNGVHYVMEDKKPLKVYETEYGVDIVASVPTSYIPDIIAHQLGEPVELISLDSIRKGGEYIRKLLENLPEGKTIVCDAVDTTDLDEIAKAIYQIENEPLNVLSVGSVGLFQSICHILGREAECSRQMDLKTLHQSGKVVVLAGSLNPLTINQVETAVAMFGEKIELLELDVIRLIVPGDERVREIKRIQNGIKNALKENKHVIVKSCYPLLELKNGDVVAESFGKSIKDDEIMENLSLLVLTGGETAIHVTEELGAWGIEIKGSLEPFIPFGISAGGKYEGTMVVTKAGGFGSQGIIADMIRLVTGTTNHQSPLSIGGGGNGPSPPPNPPPSLLY